MFEQIKSLLQKDKLQQDQNAGRALDWLKQIHYFNQLDSQFGSEYLLMMLPLCHPFILRESFSLINENDLYVHVQGDLRSQEGKFEGNRSVQVGKLIDLRENQNITFKAFSDCNMIRIQRGAGTMNQAQKKLQETERERTKKIKEYQKMVIQPQNHIKLDIVQNTPFFSVLGEYDTLEFALGCTLKQYSQHMQTHQSSEKVNKIGYIVSGKVKLTLMEGNIHRKSNEIYWFMNEGDWIGLEQYLWDKPQITRGEVQTISAIILWIPYHLFQSKFNIKTNYQALSKLVSLIKTKRLLLERSLDCRKRKEIQIDAQHNSKLQLNPELQAKVQALQAQTAKKKTYFSRTRFQSTTKRDLPIPDQILHKTSNLADEAVVLPRLDHKTIVLFPEEYANSPINPTYQKEINRLKSIINKQREKQHHSTLDLKPQALYNTIYQKIAFKYPSNSASKRPPSQRKLSSGKTIQHFNSSIYNNFKINRHTSKEPLNKNKTLKILSSTDF